MNIILLSNGFTIIWGMLSRSEREISAYKTYTYTMPITFVHDGFSVTTCGSTANAVFGISNITANQISWSERPTNDKTSVSSGYYIALGY